MLEIWGRKDSINVQKVMWTVGQLGLAHVRHDVGGAFGGLDTSAYKAMNPNALIPTIRDGDTVVWESHAVVRYLAARYGAGRLWPEDPAARAAADQWMDWSQTTLQPDLNMVFRGLVRTPPERRDMPAIQAAAGRLGGIFAILDRWLADRTHVAGDAFTMGDIPVGAACFRYFALDIARPDLPNVEAYYARLQEREPYRQHVMIPFRAGAPK